MQLFIVLAVAQYVQRLLFTVLSAAVSGAAAHDFQYMPAVWALEGFGQLASRRAVHHLTELGYQDVRVDPAQGAAIQCRARVFREVLRQIGEVFASHDALVQAFGQAFGFGFAADFAGLDQDVANIHFVTHLAVAAAFFQQLEHDKAAWSAHRLSHLANRQGAKHAVEGRWQLCGFTPAHFAAFQRGFTGRACNRQLGKVGALLQLLIQIACLMVSSLNVLSGSAFGYWNQDVGQAEFFRQLHLAHVRGEEVLHFLIGDLNTFRHAALAHAADDHLATYLVACVGVGQAVFGQGGTELLDAHAIALGNGADGLVQLFVGNPNAGAFADLQLDVLDDQALQHLLAEHMLRRQCCTALGDGLLHFTQA